MDLHALPRRDLQALAKRNGVKANMSNAAMADALAALPAVDGIEEYVQQPVAEPTPAAEPEVQAPAEEEKETEKQEISPHEVIELDDSEEEEKDLTLDQDEEKASALDVGRRRATRRTRAEPVAAPATRRRAAASKADKADPAVEAIPARATRGRSQRTVAEDEEPKARRTSRRAVAKKAGTEQEDEEKGTQGDVSSGEGGDGAAQKEEQNAPVEEQSKEDEGETVNEDAPAEAVPARATRARCQRTAAAEEAPPKARRTSRRAVARKAGTEQEEEEKGTQGDVSDMETAMAAPVSSDEGRDGAAQKEEQNAPVEEQSQEGEGQTEKEVAAADPVPARATRARRLGTGVSAAAEEAPKARRTTRRAAARRTGTDQEEEEKGEQGDVPDMGAAVPAPADAEEMEVVLDAQNEERFAAVEAVPARATRPRSQKTVKWADQLPKTRRTSRRAAASKTGTEQEEAQCDVSDVEAAVPAPVSSDEGRHAAEEVEVAMDAQNEEQCVAAETQKEDAAVEAVPARTTRARRQRAVVPAAEEIAPKARRTSRRAAAGKTSTEQEEEAKATQGVVSDVETAVPAPVSPDVGDDVADEMEAAIHAYNEEQVEEQSQEEEGVAADIPAPVEEEPAVAEDCMVDSSVEEQLVDVQRCENSPVVFGLAEQEGNDAFQNDGVSSEGIHHASEDEEMVPVDEVLQTPLKSGEENEVPTSEEVLQSAVEAIDEQEDMAADVVTDNTDVSVEDMAGHASEENEDCTAEDEPPVAEDEDSSVQEPLVHVQQREDSEMVPVNELQQAIMESCEATEEVDSASDVGEENGDCTGIATVEEPAVAEDVDSSVQEQLVDVQEYEATEEIQFAGEDTEMVAVNEVPQGMLDSGEAAEEDDCASDVEGEPPVAEDVDSSVQEPLVDVQQCEATQEIPHASEDAEMVPVLESSEATEEDDFTSYDSEEIEAPNCGEMLQNAAKAVEENEVPTSGELLQSSAQAVEETEDIAADEVPHNTDEYVEEEAVVATKEMPQISEAMDQGEVAAVDNMSQATVTDDEGAVKESGFSCDLADVSVEEKEVAAADGMPQSSPTMEENVQEVVTVDNMWQAMVDDEGAVKESGFTCELRDVPVEEDGVVAADVVEGVVTVDNLSQAAVTDEEGAVQESVFRCGLSVLSVDGEEVVMAAEEMQLSSPTMNKSVEEEVVTVDNLSQATVTDDEGAVKESGFSCDDLADVSVEEKEVVAADEMPLSSATMDENVEEEVVTVENLSQATVTDHEGALMESGFTGELMDVPVEEDGVVAADVVEGVVTVDNLSQAAVTDEEGAVQESVFRCGLSVLSVDGEEVVMAAEEMQLSSPTMNKSVEEEVVTVHNLSVTDDEWAVDECTPVVDAARDFSYHIASPFSANVFEYATKSLSMDSITVEPKVAEPADVPRSLCMYSSSSNGGKKDASEPVAMQQENEVKEGDEAEAVFGRIIHSPLTIRKLRMAVAQEIEADDVPPLTIRKQRMAAVGHENEADDVRGKKNASESVAAAQPENEVKEGKEEPEAAFGRIMHSPLTIRKLRMAVAEENEADSVPPLSIRKLRMDASEPVAVQRENQVNKSEAAFGETIRCPLSITKLRMAVAQENQAGSVPPLTIRKPRMAVAQEADSVPLCIFSSSGGEDNSAELSGGLRTNLNEKVVVAQENEVTEGKKTSTPLDTLSLRTNLNEKVVVAQENEVTEGKKTSTPLDTLSLRKLRLKLKETLTAQKNTEPKRVALGRLDENVC